MPHTSRVPHSLLLVLFSVSLFAVPIPGKAQTPANIVLHVAVQDDKGQSIKGLEADNFQITVNKIPQKLSTVSSSVVPSSIGILIDDSGSVFNGPDGKRRKEQLFKGLADFVAEGKGASEYFTLLQFQV